MTEFDDNNELGYELSDEQYFFEVFNTISEDVISDEYFDKNKRLLIDISNNLHDMHERTGTIPPQRARRIIEGIFSSIKINGIR